MSEVVIDGCAWVPKNVFPNRALQEIKRENVVKLKAGPYDDEATAVKVYRETPTHIGLPRAFFEETSNGIHDIEYDVSERPLEVECQIEPRDDTQVSGVRNVTRRLQERRVTQTIFKSGTGTGKCLREDALVSTKEGLKRIGDIVPDLDNECVVSDGIEVDTFHGKQSVDTFYAKRKADCLKATTSSGYEVSGTYNHPVLVFREEGGFEWVELQDLSVGDTIVLRHFDIEGNPVQWPDIDCFEPETDHVTEDFAWLIGLLVGDGCFVRDGNISLTNENSEVIDRASRILESIGFNLSNYGGSDSITYNITGTNKHFRELLSCLGVSFEKSGQKSVPDFVFESGKDVISSFISGYWDADGYFSKPSRREATVTSSSRQLLREIQILLLGFGVKSNLSVKKGRYKGEEVNHHRLTVCGGPLKLATDCVFEDLSIQSKRNRAKEIAQKIDEYTSNPNKYNPPAGKLFERLNGLVSTNKARRMYRGQTRDHKQPSKRVLKRFYRHINQQRKMFDVSSDDIDTLSELCRDDVFFDTVTSIEYDGKHRVCDLEIIGERNFVANGVVCHNSCMSLMVAAELGLAPLILTHTSAIMSNWIKQIKKDPGVFPDANVGIFKGDTREFGDDYDIVVGMIQTLINRDEDHPIFEWPGIILVDEVHRMAAPVFSKVISRFKAAKRLGFSATVRRKDGGEPVFYKNLGRVCWEGGQTSMTPLIRPVQTDFYIKDDVPSWLEKKWMTEDEDRNAIIADEAVEAYEAGRNPMVMTCFVSHIALLKDRIEDRCDADIGLCCGAYYTDEEEALEYIRDGKQFQEKFDTDEIIEWWLDPEDSDPPDNFDPDAHKAKFKWKEERETSGPGRGVTNVDVLTDKYRKVKPKKDDDGEWIDAEEGRLYEESESDFQERFDHAKIVRWIKFGKSYSAPDPFDPDKHKAVFSDSIEDVLHDRFKEVEPRTESISSEQFDEFETKKDILLSTFGKIKEGFDEPRLDAGILAIPKSDPEQLVGRFTREVDGKQDPVFTHLIDDRMGKFEWKWDEAKKVYRGMDAEVFDL